MAATSPILSEVRSFLALAASGRTTADQIRREIGRHNPERRRILNLFDCLRGHISPALRAAIVAMLRTEPLRQVHHKLGIPWKTLKRISKEEGAAFRKIGPGRRFLPDLFYFWSAEALGLGAFQIGNLFLLGLRTETFNSLAITQFSKSSVANEVGRDLAKASVWATSSLSAVGTADPSHASRTSYFWHCS